MRAFLLVLLPTLVLTARAQDPDQNPYWVRCVFVEDSSALVPLQGDYQVTLFSCGQWWSMSEGPCHTTPLKLRPLFEGLPGFRVTPARGFDLPTEELEVVRGQDTMVVDLRTVQGRMMTEERCRTMDCPRRPPAVVVFRPGRHAAVPWYPLGEVMVDPRTESLTAQFDTRWKEAVAQDRLIAQRNTDTCRYDVLVPADTLLTASTASEVWLLRSPYCGIHLLRFPPRGAEVAYDISGGTAAGMETTTWQGRVHVKAGEEATHWLDVSTLRAADYTIHVLSKDTNGQFILKLR